MKYFYTILVMSSLTIFVYPETSNTNKVQHYDMTEYQITITPEK